MLEYMAPLPHPHSPIPTQHSQNSQHLLTICIPTLPSLLFPQPYCTDRPPPAPPAQRKKNLPPPAPHICITPAVPVSSLFPTNPSTHSHTVTLCTSQWSRRRIKARHGTP